MKKILQICLPISLGLLTQFAMAQSHTLAPKSFGHGEDFIHITTVHTSGADAHASLYLGTRIGSTCFKKTYIAGLSGFFQEGTTIGTPADIFDGQKLNKRSCAIEEFVMDISGKKVKTDYKLINDGTHVTSADPAQSDVNFPE